MNYLPFVACRKRFKSSTLWVFLKHCFGLILCDPSYISILLPAGMNAFKCFECLQNLAEQNFVYKKLGNFNWMSVLFTLLVYFVISACIFFKLIPDVWSHQIRFSEKQILLALFVPLITEHKFEFGCRYLYCPLVNCRTKTDREFQVENKI